MRNKHLASRKMLTSCPAELAYIGRLATSADLVFQHITRNATGFAECFTPDGIMTVSSRLTGMEIDRAHGRAGIASLARRFHENAECRDLRVSTPVWSADGYTQDWNCIVRNWGSGPPRAVKGSLRARFDGALLSELTLSCDGRFYAGLQARALRPIR